VQLLVRQLTCDRERGMTRRLGTVHHDMRRPFDYLGESTDFRWEINTGNLTALAARRREYPRRLEYCDLDAI
jgi:hypothetical protein